MSTTCTAVRLQDSAETEDAVSRMKRTLCSTWSVPVHSRTYLSTIVGHCVNHQGRLYRGWDYYPFLEGHVPSFPLETLRANGYVIAGVWGSRILHYPSSQLLESFDENFLLDQDNDAFPVVDDFLAEREADGRPYFLMVFLYTPHYPFDLVEPQNMRFQPAFHGDTRSAFTPTGTRRRPGDVPQRHAQRRHPIRRLLRANDGTGA